MCICFNIYSNCDFEINVDTCSNGNTPKKSTNTFTYIYIYKYITIIGGHRELCAGIQIEKKTEGKK